MITYTYNFDIDSQSWMFAVGYNDRTLVKYLPRNFSQQDLLSALEKVFKSINEEMGKANEGI